MFQHSVNIDLCIIFLFPWSFYWHNYCGTFSIPWQLDILDWWIWRGSISRHDTNLTLWETTIALSAVSGSCSPLLLFVFLRVSCEPPDVPRPHRCPAQTKSARNSVRRKMSVSVIFSDDLWNIRCHIRGSWNILRMHLWLLKLDLAESQCGVSPPGTCLTPL